MGDRKNKAAAELHEISDRIKELKETLLVIPGVSPGKTNDMGLQFTTAQELLEGLRKPEPKRQAKPLNDSPRLGTVTRYKPCTSEYTRPRQGSLRRLAHNDASSFGTICVLM